MPTTIAAPIEEKGADFTFEEYVWRAATLFFSDTHAYEILKPNRRPDGYYYEQLHTAQAELAALDRMPADRLQNRLLFEHNAATANHAIGVARVRRAHDAYLRMRDRVEQWNPPEEFKDLKRVMLEQIALSDKPVTLPAPELETVDAWLARKRQNALRRIGEATEALARERKRCEEDNRWIAKLATVVPPPEKKP